MYLCCQFLNFKSDKITFIALTFFIKFQIKNLKKKLKSNLVFLAVFVKVMAKIDGGGQLHQIESSNGEIESFLNLMVFSKFVVVQKF